MSNLHTKTEKYPKEEYNKEPVYYCEDCLSLKVMNVAGIKEAAYCEECGSTHISMALIEEWDDLYRLRYGFKFLDNKY